MKKRLKNILVVVLAIVCAFSSVYIVSAENEDEPIVPPVDTVAPADPTDTPVPTDTPTPTFTTAPVATNTPVPTSTSTPVPTVNIVATNTPTNPPTNTPTNPPAVAPTNTPEPVETEPPVAEPTTSEEPDVESSPTPTATLTPTPYLTVIPPAHEKIYPGPKQPSDKTAEIKSAAVIKVDGIYESLWDDTKAVEIENVGWGEDGASGRFKTYWDKMNLYILVDVDDSTPDTDSNRFSRQDCVEIFINESFNKPEEYGKGDYHYKINRKGVIEYGNGGSEELIKYALIEKDNGYMVEVQIPFKVIKPKYSMPIGFDVRINDSKGNQFRDYMKQWSDTTMETYTNLTRVGTLVLK